MKILQFLGRALTLAVVVAAIASKTVLAATPAPLHHSACSHPRVSHAAKVCHHSSRSARHR